MEQSKETKKPLRRNQKYLTPDHSSDQKVRHHWDIFSKNRIAPVMSHPKHSRNNNQRVRHHWGIVWKTRIQETKRTWLLLGVDQVLSQWCLTQYTTHTCPTQRIKHVYVAYVLYTAQTPLRDASVQGPPLRLNCAEKLYITMVLLIFRFATTNWTCCCCCCCCLSWDGVTPDSLL